MQRPSPFTFGTARCDDPSDPKGAELVARALEAGAWLHGAATYGRSLEVIRDVIRQRGRRDDVHLVAKSRTRTPEHVRAEIAQTLERSGLERLAAVQICAHPDPALFAAGHPYRAQLEAEKSAGRVGGYLLELFHPFCADLRPLLEDDLFEGAVFYYSAFNREVDDATLATLERSGKWIAGLRPFCGGRLGDGLAAHGERGKKIEREGAHDAKFEELSLVAGRAGVPSLRELSIRFLRSVPSVGTVVGSTRRKSHLGESIRDVATADPLPDDVVAAIRALHSAWWNAAGGNYTTNTSTDLPEPPESEPQQRRKKSLFGRLFGR